MRIAGWHIEGFGVFQDFEVRLPEGLTVILGPNEAGKSTLLGFLRAMLFGFPSRRGRAPQYPPLRGGRHGGRLIVAGGEEIVIERFAGRKNGMLLNGREASQEDLHPLLGGADERLFSSVFAFGLSEIQSFAWLEAEQIRERIFSAGIAGAGASARRVMDALQEEANGILRSRGTSRVRDLTEQIEQAEKRLEAARREAERFTALEDEEESSQKQAALLSEEEAGLLERLRALEAQKTSADVARNAVRRIEEELAAKERLREELKPDEGLETIADRVEELHGQIARYLNRVQTLDALREQKSRNAVWLGLGAALAGGEVWVVGKNGLAAAVAALVVALVGVACLLYERGARRSRIASHEEEIAQWQDPVRALLSSSNSGERLTEEFSSFRERFRGNREVRAKATRLDDTITEIKIRLESARRELGPEAPAGESAPILESLRDVRRRRDEAVVAQRLAENERRRIAESAAVPTIQGELECLRTELAAAMREWRVLTLARELAGRTLQEFTATRQPVVLEEASSAFARVTAGAYERVLQEEDGQTLVAVDRHGQRKRLEELSRGTAEQLYLCVRLGLASEFARRSVVLPLVMDDVLVNFDPERASAVARELARFSTERQILVFTCHPETVNLFTEAKPGLIVIRLPRQRESAAKN